MFLGGNGFDNGLTDSFNLRPFRYADSINPCINHYVYIVDFSNKIVCHNHSWFILIFLASDAPNIQKSKIYTMFQHVRHEYEYEKKLKNKNKPILRASERSRAKFVK